MAGRFTKFVAHAEEALPKLPLFHTCDGYTFRLILSTDQLVPTQCKVFGEALLYFFYGRPAYRAVKGEKAVSHPSFLPVCIMVRPDAPLSPVRVAPFDTGAFSKGIFSDYMHPNMTCSDFLVKPASDMPGRIVKAFFGTNGDYFYGQPVIQLGIPPLEFEAKSYSDLVASSISSLGDDRKQTIEVQVKDSLNLASKNVLLVILPAIFLEDEEVKAALIRWSAEVRGYPTFHWNPREYTSTVFSLAAEYLRREGLI